MAAATLRLHADTEFSTIIEEMGLHATALAETQGQFGANHPALRSAQANHAATRGRALARASMHGPIQVLYPMISHAEQFVRLRALFDQAVADLQPAELQHGILFEVPAACLAARELMQVADFGCIGTNDLIQYLFAADRRGSDTAGHARFETDAVLWNLIRILNHRSHGVQLMASVWYPFRASSMRTMISTVR